VSQLLVATTNPGKVAEFAPLVADLGLVPVGLDAFPDLVPAVEDGETLRDNAILKALHAHRETGLPTLADDSGLEVAALGGAPGVHSARFAGEDADAAANNALLLERLAGVSDRRAAFACWLCLAKGGEVSLLVDGRCEGTILETPRGAQGFGYDPLFVPDHPSAGGRAFAELTREQKSPISHRGLAVAALKRALSGEASA
jgi:XTP/dITP diphosphohydrolase